MQMNERGFLPRHDCKRCGKPLQGEDSGRPAELYLGTYTGLCYPCTNAGPWIEHTDSDGAQHWNCPPHCPSWRRDREPYTGYADCPTCKGAGRLYVSRGYPQGGPYYQSCKTCFDRYYAHPLRKWASTRGPGIYHRGQRLFEAELKRRKLWKAAKTGTAPKETVEAIAQPIRDRVKRLSDRFSTLSHARRIAANV